MTKFLVHDLLEDYLYHVRPELQKAAGKSYLSFRVSRVIVFTFQDLY